jgi:peptide-methionine (S)-S-oxide reductase
MGTKLSEKSGLKVVKTETATLGGGCYWCLDAIYRRVNGVVTVVSGYSGGHYDNPSALDVYNKDTGHAECVQMTFDPSVITYREILEIFFVMHNPTTLNQQDNDVGEIYRSVVFYHSDPQRETAKDMIDHFAADLWPDPVVTELVEYEKFWPAQEDMQEYYERNPNAGYCMVIIDPKIQKLRKKFAAKLKPAS